MRIVLATGIYPPQIGGPATYAKSLAHELSALGMQVTVLAYGDPEPGVSWHTVGVSRGGIFLHRWLRYARALRIHASNADAVYVLSSVSVGIPLILAGIPRTVTRVLRLGGDFFWERYTQRGGSKGLVDWYASKPFSVRLFATVLRQFDHLLFSTKFQRDLYAQSYTSLPKSSVIENALPRMSAPDERRVSDPFRLLWMGRMTPLKNVESLVRAMVDVKGATLLLVGTGPSLPGIRSLIESLDLHGRVAIAEPVSPGQRDLLFMEHHALVLPSFSEVSPNIALEARASGLPVIVTKEVGLSDALKDGMLLIDLRSPANIAAAIDHMRKEYSSYAKHAAAPVTQRTWRAIAEEHVQLFRSLRT
jgi:glycosyltransferase involved in cell wall biosynthesis